MTTEEIIGMWVDEVTEHLEVNSVNWRIVKLDGIPSVVTSDFKTDRVNLIVQDNLVVDAYHG